MVHINVSSLPFSKIEISISSYGTFSPLLTKYFENVTFYSVWALVYLAWFPVLTCLFSNSLFSDLVEIDRKSQKDLQCKIGKENWTHYFNKQQKAIYIQKRVQIGFCQKNCKQTSLFLKVKSNFKRKYKSVFTYLIYLINFQAENRHSSVT